MEIRPTGDRLKESLFNILGPRTAGAVMLDVFGGTGSIGIEAISRGADEVAFIESSSAAQKLILRNIKSCGIEGGYRLISQDAFTALRAMIRKGFHPDIVFFDPPYDFKPYADLLGLAFDKRLLSPGGRAIIEHHRKALLPESGAMYAKTRVVRQGDHCLSFYEYLEASSQETGVRSQETVDRRQEAEEDVTFALPEVPGR